MAVTPEKASLPPHCMPTSRSDKGRVSLFLSFKIFNFFSAILMRASIMASNPFSSWRTITFSGLMSAWSMSISTVIFSQPKDTTISCPPKLGCLARLRRMRMGTLASGALMATPQP